MQKLIKYTSVLPVILICVGAFVAVVGAAIALKVNREYFLHVLFSGLIISYAGIPIALICLFFSYRNKIITLGNLLISLFLTLISGGVFYFALAFTLWSDVKKYFEHISKNK